ncbi:hypothetical protein AWM75_07315 [Aerococcus urinaehominis]|uniref:Uncharacterized protein n=1 Tax=Aerococcus urinaehominis TaxID=128944 RepID=A0A0X8FLZ7_9LACT|nr:PAS domain-containing protein [Aerococcus urinaehominis]AMB99782.1 hypothetical protein AWM75_07315 [Aerococcus urinaehominis]SDM09199.1 Predicted transcriptional regulator YheO, contains PAS and DNA-binding HTH domains [Aerococcus urinaehominis]
MPDEIIQQYISLVRFLGQAIGDQFEFVLHAFDTDGDMYIAEIINGQLSGRSKDSPITQFALDLINNKTYLDQDYLVDYKTKTQQGKLLQGSTFFIKNNQQDLLGMLCINMDYSKQFEMADDIIRMLNLPINIRTAEMVDSRPEAEDDFAEVLSESLHDIILQVVGADQLNENVQLTQEARVDIVARLEERGVFQIKGSVSQVAQILGVSEPSIYRYRRMIPKN